MQLLLALLAVYFIVRPRGVETAAQPAGIVQPEGITNANPVTIAEALEGYTPNTPIVYVDGDVTRETTTGKLAQDYRAAGIMRDDEFLPGPAGIYRPVPNTSQPFAI